MSRFAGNVSPSSAIKVIGNFARHLALGILIPLVACVQGCASGATTTGARKIQWVNAHPAAMTVAAPPSHQSLLGAPTAGPPVPLWIVEPPVTPITAKTPASAPAVAVSRPKLVT